MLASNQASLGTVYWHNGRMLYCFGRTVAKNRKRRLKCMRRSRMVLRRLGFGRVVK